MDATPLWASLTERTKAFVAVLIDAGSSATLWSLPDMGIQGNSHMFMMDNNNAEIAAMLGGWMLGHEGEVHLQTG